MKSLQDGSGIQSDVQRRLNAMQQDLGPTVDAFADGIHKIGQYRDAADHMASRVLQICSEKLAERDKKSDVDPRRDLSSVLRGLSRVDR
jgi:hypothetical protein